MNQKFSLNVNGKTHKVEADPDTPLLYVCATISASTIRISAAGSANAAPAPCISTASRAFLRDAAVAGRRQEDRHACRPRYAGEPHPLQAAYVAEQVPQCAYCINGWIMTAAAFLRDNKKPTDDEIRTALHGLKCRCGTHMAILRAVKRAAAMMG